MSETVVLFLEFIFKPSCWKVFVSTEDAASGIFLADAQKGLERERGI